MIHGSNKERNHVKEPDQHLVGCLLFFREKAAEVVPAESCQPRWRGLLHVVPVERIQLFKIKNRLKILKNLTTKNV